MFLWQNQPQGRSLILVLAVLIFTAIQPGRAEAQLQAFVTNRLGNSLSVIDLETQTVAQTYAVGLRPVGVAVDRIRRVAYTANSGSASISRIDLVTGQVTSFGLLGSIPESVSINHDGSFVVITSLERVPVGMGTKGKVYLLDGDTFTFVAEALVDDDPEGIDISGDGDQAWIASDLKIQELILEPGPFFLTLTNVASGVEMLDDFEDVAVLSNKSRLYGTNALRNRVDVYSLSTETLIGTIPTGTSPEAVVLRTGTIEGHVTNQTGNSITVFDRNTFAVLDTMPLDGIEPRGLAFTPDGAEGYVVMSQSDNVIRYDASTRTQIGQPIAVGSRPEEIVIARIGDGVTAARRWIYYKR